GLKRPASPGKDSAGARRGSRRSIPSRAPCWRIASRRWRTLATSRRSKPEQGQLTFSWEEPLVSPSPSLDGGLEWMTLAATSPWNISGWLRAFDRTGLFGKTSLASCRSTGDGRLEPCWGRWLTSGTGSLTEFWTLSSSECPSAAAASSLLDILEGGRLPLRYFLSARACAGILRRAAKRKRSLPPLLRTALERVAAIQSRPRPVTSSPPPSSDSP